MEPDEIGVVLARASELHAKISDAIERALKSEFLLSTSGRSPKTVGGLENLSTSQALGIAGYGKENRRYSESDLYERGSTVVAGEGSAEARSLGAIRDALEVLEEQLESLQTVQQQQRTEKDAVLADLEESRRILLSRLKDHRGREWEVVHEALAFAGEPVEDKDELPLPPYPKPLSEFHTPKDEHLFPGKYNGLKHLSFGRSEEVDRDEVVPYTGEGNESEDENQEEGTRFHAERGRKKGGGVIGGVLGIPGGFAKAIFGFAYGMTSKVAIIAISVAAALAVSEVSQRLEERKPFANFSLNKPPASPPITTARQMPPQRECPPGKKLIIEDGFAKCIVKERVEVPFYREVKTPDVLYGRG